MEYVLRNEMELGLKDLFVKANAGAGNFIEWFKGLNGLKETEKADKVKMLVDSAKNNNSEIFKACNVVYNEKDLKVTLFEIPEILTNGKLFTHCETQRNIEFIDFTSFILCAVVEEFKLGYINFQAYLDFDEETDNEEDLEKQIKIATTEEEKYLFIEEIVGIKFDDMQEHFIYAYYEDLDEQRMFVKFDNGIEIVIDKLG